MKYQPTHISVKFDPKDIISVYSGKHGCCCGCLGKYSYSSHAQEEGGRRIGYDVSNDEVSDRSVKIIMNKFQKLVDKNGVELVLNGNARWSPEPEQVYYLGDCTFTFDTETRTYLLNVYNKFDFEKESK